MPASAEAAAKTKDRIHEAAVALFTTQGFHGTGMREIAARAEVSLGNIYNHHKTKDQLFAALLDEYEARYTATDTPLAKALASFKGLDDLEALGDASRAMVHLAEKAGALNTLRDFGGQVTVDTCILASPMLPPEVKTLMTNSAKYAYYAPGLLNTRVTFGSLADCVRSAVAGRVVREAGLWAA